MNYNQLKNKFDKAIDQIDAEALIKYFEDRGYEFEDIISPVYVEKGYDDYSFSGLDNYLFSDEYDYFLKAA